MFGVAYVVLVDALVLQRTALHSARACSGQLARRGEAVVSAGSLQVVVLRSAFTAAVKTPPVFCHVTSPILLFSSSAAHQV